MIDVLEKILFEQFYTRAELMRAVGVLREVLSYTSFTKGKLPSDVPALLPQFEGERQTKAEDMVLLRSIPEKLWTAFERDTFQEKLDELVQHIDALPAISLTIPLELDKTHIIKIGQWARQNVDTKIIIDLEVDSELGVGCRIRWKHELHDYSLAHYLERSGEDVRAYIAKQLTHVAAR